MNCCLMLLAWLMRMNQSPAPCQGAAAAWFRAAMIRSMAQVLLAGMARVRLKLLVKRRLHPLLHAPRRDRAAAARHCLNVWPTCRVAEAVLQTMTKMRMQMALRCQFRASWGVRTTNSHVRRGLGLEIAFLGNAIPACLVGQKG